MSQPPLYESWDPNTLRATEVTVDPDDKRRLIFIHAQNVKPIIESAKRIASNADPSAAWRKNGWVHVARIPMVEWMRIKALGIPDDPKAFDEYLNLRETRLMRTDDGRKV